MYGGIHAIDRLLWLLEDDVVAVVAREHRYGGLGDVEDGLVALLELRGGATAVLFENSPPYGRPGGWATKIFGSEGAIRVQTGEWLELTSRTKTFTLASQDDLHFNRQIAEFVAAIVERREPWVPAAAGLRSLKVALAVYESARLGARVALAER
jgi:UDP-N-acetyl-2-amino-2-deoxyglucuronate dehydrogenase